MLLVVACSCLCFLRGRFSGRRQLLILPMAGIWLFTCLFGMLDRAVNLLPRQLADKRSGMIEMENNVREYLATGNAMYLDGNIPFPNSKALQQILISDSIRRVLPSNLIDQTPPLSPSDHKYDGSGFVQNGCPVGVAPPNRPVFGSYTKDGVEARSGIRLYFTVPRGTRQADILVAGYPNAKGMSLNVGEPHGIKFSIAPPFDPGDRWQMMSITLNPKFTTFTINGTSQSGTAWFAFSMPTLSRPCPRPVGEIADSEFPLFH